MRYRLRAILLAFLTVAALCARAAAPEKPVINPPPTARDWADLAKLPDWSGVWNPKITDQDAQARTNMPPWNPKAAELVRFQLAEEKAGRPPPLFVNCLPEAMPSWMLVTHNAMEILFTPGRVTMLGESDGNRLRRIYTDGRPHPDIDITAPKILTKPWKTTRIFFRQRARKFDIVEGVCLEGYFAEKIDKDGNAVFVPIPHAVGGNRVPPE